MHRINVKVTAFDGTVMHDVQNVIEGHTGNNNMIAWQYDENRAVIYYPAPGDTVEVTRVGS